MLMFLVVLVASATTLTVADNNPYERITSALTSPRALQKLYSDFSLEQGRTYTRADQRVRLGLFRKNLQEIAEHNSHDDSWQMGINMFSDMTDEEKYSYTGANFTVSAPEEDIPEYQAPLTAGPAAGSKDWRSGKAVTKVKNQGRCGSCWVFSAVGALEGAYKNQGSILKSFSEQEGLECSMRNGCGGGWMHYVYNYAKKAGRYAAMKDAPYKGKEGPCRFSSTKDGLIAFKISGHTNAKGDSRHVSALSSSGPLSVAYTCTKKFFQYKGGIYRESRCSGGGHAVTSVGYAPDYFIMKNSWGKGFGESGYFRIGRGNVCGITNQGLIPTLRSTGNKDPGQDESGDDGGDDDNGKTCVAEDKNSRCAEWAARDPSECTENWRWMTDNCRKSCKQCDCVDVGLKCAEWKGKGYCEKEYVTFMTRLCRKTCDKCGEIDDGDNNGDCQEGFKKCPDGSCVHEHWNC